MEKKIIDILISNRSVKYGDIFDSEIGLNLKNKYKTFPELVQALDHVIYIIEDLESKGYVEIRTKFNRDREGANFFEGVPVETKNEKAEITANKLHWFVKYIKEIYCWEIITESGLIGYIKNGYKTDDEAKWETEQKNLNIERRFSKTINIFLVIIALASFFGTVIFSSITVKKYEEANKINKLASEQDYYNQQPFMIIVDGNEDATSVKIKNVGGGPAQNIYFLKNHKNPELVHDYALTREGDIILGMAKDAEGNVNINSQNMDELNMNQVLDRLKCLSKDFLEKRDDAYIMIFYRSILGDSFVTSIYGTNTAYEEALKFEKLNCTD